MSDEYGIIMPAASVQSHTLRSSIFLILSSFFVLLEGAVRTSSSAALTIATPDGAVPILGLVAGVCEVLMGIWGIWLGIRYWAGEALAKPLVSALLVWQHVAGYFIFISFNMAIPGTTLASLAPASLLPDPQLGTLVGVAAIFSGLGLCFAVQGGQISFTFGLLYDRKEYDDRFHRIRANVYLIVALWVQVWWLIGAAVAGAEPVAFPPFFLTGEVAVVPAVTAINIVLILCAIAGNNVSNIRTGVAASIVTMALGYLLSLAMLVMYSAGTAGAMPAATPLTSAVSASFLIPTIFLGSRRALLGPANEAHEPLSIVK